MSNINKAIVYVKWQLSITGSSQDTQLREIVKTCVNKIKLLTRIDLLNSDSEKVEIHNGAWQKTIFLKNAPIDTLTTVEENHWSQATPDRVELDRDNFSRSKKSVIIDSWYRRGYENIKITTAMLFTDFDAIPEEYSDLKYALSLMTWNFMKIKDMSWLKSESVSWTSLTFDKNIISEDVMSLLSDHRHFAI